MEYFASTTKNEDLSELICNYSQGTLLSEKGKVQKKHITYGTFKKIKYAGRLGGTVS